MKIIIRAMVLSLQVIVLVSCSFLATVPTVMPTSTNAVVPTSTSTLPPTSTQTATPAPQFTKTAKPSTVVNTSEGKQFISHDYGFSIFLPSDSQSVVYNRADLVETLIAELPQIYLDDGGHLVSMLHAWVEEPTDQCHSWTPRDPVVPIRTEHMSLGGNSYTKVYTPDVYYVYGIATQDVEYSTYGMNFCVHFYINLTTHYFDPGDAPSSNMLPYMQEELDRIISTFQWAKP